MSETASSASATKLNADVGSSPEVSESSPSNEPSSPPASPDSKYTSIEMVSPVNQPESPVFAVLQSRPLWRQFSAVRTEMIVTRRGRRMFPPLKIELFNLDPTKPYVLLVDMFPVDKFRYKYQSSSWVKCFEEECLPSRLYIHPDSPALGSHWMNTVVSFYKLKLTNNQLDKQGHIIVSSMHHYQPRLHLVESADVNNLNWECFNTFVFPETQFITVTAYQNDKITQLKIDHNPFAKGFRSPFSRCRTRHNSDQRCALPSSSDSGTEDTHPPLTTMPQALLPASPDHKGLKRALQCEDQDSAPTWSKHVCHSPEALSTGGDGGQSTNLSYVTAPPQLIAMPTQGIPLPAGSQYGRFLIVYSVPPTPFHLPQFSNGVLVQQATPIGRGTGDPPQLNIGGPQVIQATPNYANATRPFLVQGGQPQLVGGATLLPAVGSSALLNSMALVQQAPCSVGNVGTIGSLVYPSPPDNVELSSTKVGSPPTAGSPGSSPGTKATKTTLMLDGNSRKRVLAYPPPHPPPPPPLLQVGGPASGPSMATEGIRVSVPSPPRISQPCSMVPSSAVPGSCIQRLVILGDTTGKAQGPTAVLPPPADPDQVKALSYSHVICDPHHQTHSPIPLYRFSPSHPIQILTPVGASVKRS